MPQNILVINPPHATDSLIRTRLRQPISLLYIVSILEKEFGFTVDFHDLSVDPLLTPVENSYTCLIITSTPLDRWETPYLDYHDCIKTIDSIKTTYHGMRVILTGAHGTITPDLLFQQSPYIDIIVRGEPEDTIRDIFNGQPLHTVKGISYRANSEITHNPLRDNHVDLDSLPMPAYHKIDIHKYEYNDSEILPKPFTIMETSRGCPHACVFCNKSMHGNRYRYRHAKNVVDEIQYLQDNFAIRSIYFQDLEFALVRKKVADFCSELKERNIELNWACAARCSDIDEDLIIQMRDSGCRRISFGLESLSNSILTVIKKKETVSGIRKARSLCQKYGIDFNPFTLVGFPGETTKTIRESLINSILLNIPISSTKVRAYPDTKLWDLGVSEGKIDITKSPWEQSKITLGRIGNDGSYQRKPLSIKFLRLIKKVQDRICKND